MSEGLKYGESGRSRVEEISKIAVTLVEQSTAGDLFVKNGLVDEIKRQTDEYPAEMLAEYFGKAENQKNMFADARYFEGKAYSKTLVTPVDLDNRQKGILSLFCDFHRIDRKKII